MPNCVILAPGIGAGFCGLRAAGEVRCKGLFDAASSATTFLLASLAQPPAVGRRGGLGASQDGRQDGCMSNFLVAVAVFLITIIGALFAVPYLVDWNGYRGVFEEEATRLLGREVRVGGSVTLHLLPTPYFRLEKVRIADASVNLQDAFFRSESVAVKLSIPPMFRGQVEANEIELQRPALRLALDARDGWNWQSFGQALGNAAYLPHNVALTSVRITDGLLAVHGPDGTERARFDGIGGEFSAPALEGPYRFKGTVGKGRSARELRIGTARAEGDGTLRFKALLRAPDGITTYTLDGRLADLAGRPHLEGELAARLPVAGLWRTPRTAAGRTAEPAAGEGASRAEPGEPVFDLRAAVQADPTGASLSSLALAFEQDGRPQMLSGDLKVLWRDAFAVEMNLSSRWLDLDRIAGGGDASGPLGSIVPLAIGLRDLLPATGRSRATFTIDQANVGGEAVSAIRLSLVRVEDRLEIEELQLGLPGGSRGELKGVVSGPPGEAAFDGSVSLRGASLVRFLDWATAGALGVDARGDGTFGVRTQLSLATGRASIRNLVGDVSGTAITASAQYRWEGRPELSLLVEGPQLDARAFIPAGASLGDVFGLLLQGPVTGRATQEPGAAKPGWRSMQTDALVRINAGELITAARTYRDVAMEVELRGGRLRLPLLRVAGDRGFSLELEGDVIDVASRPKGSLRGVVSADGVAAIAPLAELLGIPEALRPDAARAQAMVPLRLAGSMAFGLRTSTSADLVIDGEANGAAVKLNARLDGGQDGWRTGPADVTALVEGGEAHALATLLAPAGSGGRGVNLAPGRVLVKASGVPSEGLATLASAEAGDLALRFRGKLAASPSGNSAVGDLEINSANGARIAALAGLAAPLRLDGVPVAGSLRLAAREGGISIDNMALNVGGSGVRGQLALSRAGDRRRIDARLDLDEVSLAKLFAPLLDQRLAVAATAETAVTGRRNPWPDEPFDAAAFDAFEGSIRLNAGRFALADGLGLGRAGIDVALSAGKIEARIEGEALGGRCTAALRMEKVAAGADIAGSVSLADGNIAVLTGASGSIGGKVKFVGRGTTPRSAVSVLQGGGTLELGEARLATLWPGAIGKATEAALRSSPDELPSVVRRVIAAAVAGGILELPRRIDLDIADGRLTAKPFTIDSPEGRAAGSANLDLKTFDIESDWRLEQPGRSGAGRDKPPLPAVAVTYRGPVAVLGTLEPRISSEALERELAVRRMERDVEELERLRKLDEAHRREEVERQRRQIEQVPLPPPVPMAPALPAPPPATPG